MVDKLIENAYIWYSGATDVTGKKIAETLGARHGSVKPNFKDISVIIGWGTKTKDKVNLGNIPVINHPDNIAVNRNKFASLDLMLKGGVSVANFVSSNLVLGALNSKNKSDGVMLPLIGRTNYHQGGKGFWNCPTITHVKAAIDEGANYFQNMIEIKDEFRLHTFGNNVIYAVKKVKRTVEEMEDAYIKHEMDRQMSLSEKNGETLDQKTMEIFLRRQAKKFAQDGANMLIRSNRLGWKFVKMKSVEKKVEDEAVKALKAIGLDFGAVDCCIDVNGIPYVIEVNSGPGLEETTFDLWIKELNDAINTILKPRDSKSILSNLFKSKKEVSERSSKAELSTKVSLMKQMVDAANEEEASVLDKVFSKMFS
jgi:hypothetical protein